MWTFYLLISTISISTPSRQAFHALCTAMVLTRPMAEPRMPFISLMSFMLSRWQHPRWQWPHSFRRRLRHISRRNFAMDFGEGTMLKGTGKVLPCLMYSMYNWDLANFHSTSCSLWNGDIKCFITNQHLYQQTIYKALQNSDSLDNIWRPLKHLVFKQ